MRVAFLIDDFPAPPETLLFDQITGLLELGCDVEIFPSRRTRSAVAGDLWNRTHFSGLPETPALRPLAAVALGLREANKGTLRPQALNPVRYGKRAGTMRLFFESVAFSRRGRFDVVHCHTATNGMRGAMLRDLGCIPPGTRLITSFHGNDAGDSTPANAFAKLFASGDLFLPWHDAMRFKLLALGCPTARTCVHKPGVRLDLFARHRNPNTAPDRNARLRIVTVAPLIGQEGIEYAIRAIAALRDEIPGLIRYDIFGEGPLRAGLERMIRGVELQNSIHLAGLQSRTVVAEAFSKADVFLSPGTGSPGAMFEAMASGLAVVAARHVGVPDVVHDGVTGLLTSARDVRALANALAALCREPGLIESMGQEGYKIAARSHDIRVQNRALLEHYEGLVQAAA